MMQMARSLHQKSIRLNMSAMVQTELMVQMEQMEQMGQVDQLGQIALTD